MTVREMISVLQKEMLRGPVEPDRAREMLNRLSALISNCNDEIREADAEYSRHLLQCYESEKAANRAKLKAETSPEYDRKRRARDAKEVVVDLIAALKYQLRSLSDEMRLGGGSH